MDDSTARGAMPIRNPDYMVDNIYRVNQADSEQSRQSREQFQKEFKEKEDGKENPHPPNESGAEGTGGIKEIHDDVILSSLASNMIKPAVEEKTADGEEAQTPDVPEEAPTPHVAPSPPMHIDLQA